MQRIICENWSVMKLCKCLQLSHFKMMFFNNIKKRNVNVTVINFPTSVVGNCRAGLKFKVEKRKNTFFFKENVVYPFVNFCKCADNFYTISDKDYCEVLCYVEHFGVSPI